jgi:hypothetical protein
MLPGPHTFVGPAACTAHSSLPPQFGYFKEAMTVSKWSTQKYFTNWAGQVIQPFFEKAVEKICSVKTSHAVRAGTMANDPPSLVVDISTPLLRICPKGSIY